MFKKLLFSVSMIAASTNIAQASNSIPQFQSGAYGGAALGLSVMHSKKNEFVQTKTPGGVLIHNEKLKESSKRSNDLGGDIFMGYRYISDKGFLAGLDLLFSFDNNRVKHEDYFIIGGSKLNFNSQLTSRYKFIPSILLGLRFNDKYLAFLKMGMSFSQFKIKHQHNYGHGLLAGSHNDPTTQVINKQKIGFYTAAAFEVAMNHQFSTLIMASYEHYGKIKHRFYGDYNVGIPFPYKNSHDVTLKPNVLTFKLGLIYRFPSTF